MTRHFHHYRNTPGYLPGDTDPSTFLEFDEAKRSLIADLMFDADTEDEAGNLAMAEAISAAAEEINLWNDPGYGDFELVTYANTDEPHDLGMAYSVSDCFENECVTDEHLADWLARDGDLSVPCSRYGRTTIECAPVAVALLRIFCETNGESDDGLETLTEMMGYVVNDSDDPEAVILDYASDEEALRLLPYLTNRYLPRWIPEPGLGSLIAVLDDGDSLCEKCVRHSDTPVHRWGSPDGWQIVAWTTTGESDEAELCCHCSETLVG